MDTQALLLSVLASVTLTAFIGAVNARGPARMVISYLLAIICFCISVFHFTQYFVVPEEVQEMNPQVKNVVPAPSLALPAPDLAESAQEDTQSEAQSQAVAQYLGAARGVANAGAALATTLSGLALDAVEDLSDEEYERLQNNAGNSLNSARKIKNDFASLGNPPPQYSSAHQTLDQGLSGLVSACSNLDRFFHAEDKSEEAQRKTAFRSGIQQALAQLRRVTSQF